MTIVSAIIMLGILIFVHELGHFIIAKLMNVQVLKFSLGFGPKVYGRRIGETEYMISAFPLGGYVKMLGEEVGEDFPEHEKKRAFQTQSLSKRALIVFAGAFFNIILAYLIYTVVLAVHLPINIPNIRAHLPVVNEVVSGSPVDRAGLQKGDRVLKLDDKDVVTRFEVYQIIAESPGKSLKFTIKRDDKILEQQIVPEAVEITRDQQSITIGQIGIERETSPVVGGLVQDSPALKAGLKKGDRILRIDGKDIATWEEMVQVVMANPGKSLQFILDRSGQILEFQIIPREVEITEGDEKITVGRIGIYKASLYETIETENLFEAFYMGAFVTYKYGFLVFDSIRMLISGEVPFKAAAGGPITIVMESGKAAALGILPYFMFMAIISVNLGILNLLPIPVLDGGHLMFFVIESIKGRPLEEKTILIANRIGLAFLLALIFLVLYNDIMKYFILN